MNRHMVEVMQLSWIDSHTTMKRCTVFEQGSFKIKHLALQIDKRIGLLAKKKKTKNLQQQSHLLFNSSVLL